MLQFSTKLVTYATLNLILQPKFKVNCNGSQNKKLSQFFICFKIFNHFALIVSKP